MTTNPSTVRYRRIDTPIGEVTLGGGDRLRHLLMDGQAHRPDTSFWSEDPDAFPEVVEQLEAYFDGTLRSFDVQLDVEGTEFQRRVWDALVDIPYGETCTYGQLADAIGRPTAVRAVGLANGRNPVSIIVPCHRVIGADGSLTGYGGGIERKRILLDLERAGRGEDDVVPGSRSG